MAKKDLKPLLVIEDDSGLRSQLRWCFEDYDVATAENRESALAQLRRVEPPVVTLDLGLPPDAANASEGLAVLEEIVKLAPHTKVIVVTGNDDRENALRALALGAYDFYQKPIDPEILGLIIGRAYALYELEEENRQLARRQTDSPLEGLIAASPQMLEVCRTVEKIAPTDATVLLLGESGTGKEVVANALHSLSARAGQHFQAINCAAIPGALLESELFGHEKGAFTGATKQTKGKVEYAHGGTLFLDEVGDLPAELQPKILRFLQERVIERIGGREEIPVDVRVICATHQNLDELIEAGMFRQDLYYRVSEINIDIPPLREREGDTVLLAKALLAKFNEQNKRNLKGYTDDALAGIETYGWPGNVRELENKIKRAVIMADGSHITAQDMQLEKQEGHWNPEHMNLRKVREAAELNTLRQALAFTGHNVSRTAELLGISRPTLYDLMKKFGID